MSDNISTLVTPVVEGLIDNIDKVVRGKRDEIRLALCCLFTEGHLLLDDVPGTGKTSTARLLADARKVMGAAKIKQITVCTVQIAELRPKQTPALHTPADKAVDPHAAPPKNPVKSRCES